MRITARQLRQIIKEELSRSMYEADETSAAQTKVEPPAAPKAEPITPELKDAIIIFKPFSAAKFDAAMEQYVGPGLIECTVTAGEARLTGWQREGSILRSFMALKGQAASAGGGAELINPNGIGAMKGPGTPTSLPDGKHYFNGKASLGSLGYGYGLNIRPVASSNVNESRRTRR